MESFAGVEAVGLAPPPLTAGWPDREVYTTGQVAVLCRVAVRTVVNWCKRGVLRGYRLPSGHRRITRASLAVFLLRHDMGAVIGDEEVSHGRTSDG